MISAIFSSVRRFGLISTMAAVLFACTGADIEYNYPRSGPGGLPTYEKQESVFGDGGLTLFENEGSDIGSGRGGSGIGVNSFLWRASLDTVAFMPLLSADPFGGVIITDWYGPPQAKNERYKINLFILGTELRSDGVRAKVFRQKKLVSRGWDDMVADEKLDRDLEDAILTRARQLKINSAPKAK